MLSGAQISLEAARIALLMLRAAAGNAFTEPSGYVLVWGPVPDGEASQPVLSESQTASAMAALAKPTECSAMLDGTVLRISCKPIDRPNRIESMRLRASRRVEAMKEVLAHLTGRLTSKMRFQAMGASFSGSLEGYQMCLSAYLVAVSETVTGAKYSSDPPEPIVEFDSGEGDVIRLDIH